MTSDTLKKEDINKLLDDALTYHKAGEVDGAMSLYRNVLSIEPANELANNNLGIIYVMRENYDRAISHFTAVLNNTPGSVDTYFNLAKAYMFSEDFTNAVRIFEKAYKLSPRDTQIMKNLAYCHKSIGDFEEALLNYRQVLNFDENNLFVLYEIAEIYYLMENYERASEFCLKVLNRDRSNWKARGLLADSFFFLRKYEDAIELMGGLISEFPDRMEFREKVADYYLTKGDFTSALHQYETILSKEPNNLNYLQRYREIKKAMFNTEEKGFMSELESSYEEKLKLTAKKYFEKEDYNTLIKEFSKELLNNSNNLFLLKSLARAYFRLKKYSDSEKYYSRYIDIKSDDAEINLEYASVLNHTGKYLDSRRVLDNILKEGKESEDLILLMSDNLLNMGLMEEAVTVLEKYSASSNSEHVYLKLGNLYHRTGNLNSAYNLWLKGSKLFPEVNIFNMRLARLAYRMENYRQAMRHLRKYLDNDSNDFPAYEFLSEIFLKMKKPREAFRNWTDIIEKRPRSDRDILIKAKVFLYMERLDEALKQLELIQERMNDDVEYLFARGLAFLMHEDYNNCVAIWDKAYDKDRETFESFFFFIVRYFDKDKIHKLFKRWDKYEDKAVSAGQDL